MTSTGRHRESLIPPDVQGLALRAPVLRTMLESYVRGECDLRNACRMAHHELLQQTRDRMGGEVVGRAGDFLFPWPLNELSARPEALPSRAQVVALARQVGCWEMVHETRERTDARFRAGNTDDHKETT